MKTRIIPALLMVALLIPFSGCPLTPRISLGVWLFSVDLLGGDSSLVAQELGARGMAQPPEPLPTETDIFFGGTQSWTQRGSTFTFTLTTPATDIGPSVFVYTGTVDSSTSIINGTWIQTVGGTLSGTWSGMKL